MTTTGGLLTRRSTPEFEVVALSDHEWRVCDPKIDSHDPRRVLGFIAQTEGRYEVLALAPSPVSCGGYRDWDAALHALLLDEPFPEDSWRVGAVEVVSMRSRTMHEYRLRHEYDLTCLDLDEGPFLCRDAAVLAARRIVAAVTGAAA
jgi:hypothetical protein